MAGKGTDRKNKSVKDTKTAALYDKDEAVANLTLPDSLPCSEIDFPILIKKRSTANWNEIIEESNKKLKDIEEYVQSKRETPTKPPFQKTECDYIVKEVFVLLIPALEETLNKAVMWDALKKQKCFFNGIDHIAQLLWNNNPRYPDRKLNNLHLFNMPWVRKILVESPRPYYPKSWLWPEDYAATLIQKTVRQYFVQRDEEVQEMREFWKVTKSWHTFVAILLTLYFNNNTKLEIEQNVPDMEMNPYLAKKFASQHGFHKK